MNKKIVFNKPLFLNTVFKYFKILNHKKHFSSAGYFAKKCENILKNDFGFKRVILTNSCTQALEFIALMLNLKKDDEVIIPSYTFVTSAGAFANLNAKIVFIDVKKDNANVDKNNILKAISKKTKAILVVHYAGYSDDIDIIAKICRKKKIVLIEDCAHAFACKYKKKYLGTFGDFAAMSFHETKNIHCGEGGALIINNKNYFNLSETMKNKGTNRSLFSMGKINKYTWVSKGSSFMMSDIKAAFLYSQLRIYKKILNQRKKIIQNYLNLLEKKKIQGISIPSIFKNKKNCYHIFYIFVNNRLRNKLLDYLNKNKIGATFHYIPLHSSSAGKLYGKTIGTFKNANYISSSIIRLPLWNGLKIKNQKYIVNHIEKFFN